MTALLHTYAPRGAAREVFERRDDEVLLAGPAGTGKSRACLEKLNAVALAVPGMRGAIIRKVAASLGSTALETWRQHVVAEALDTGTVTFFGGSPEEAPQYRYDNGSIIRIGGMDKPSKIMSSEYDVIYVQEATELTVTDWEALTTRLRNNAVSYQQLLADANPGPPTHWLKKRCDDGTTVLLHSRHEDNPRLFDAVDVSTLGQRPGSEHLYNVTPAGAVYIGKLDRLTGVRRLRLRLGLWAAAEGLVYEEWDDAVNLVAPFTPPLEWRRWWAVDFGYVNPFVCQRWAEDGDGRLWLYAEHYRTRRTVDQHAEEILADVAPGGEWREPKPSQIICDHDAEDRATLERSLGLPTTAARKTVTSGITAVQRRIRLAGDGRPRIFICRDAPRYRDQELEEAGRPTSTYEEITSYVWATPTANRPPKDEPVKEDDHGMDALRYAVAHRDLRGTPGVRWMS